MSVRKYFHFIIPILVGILSAASTWYFENQIVSVIQNTSLQEVLFSYATTLFGFILATYGIFFGILPNVNKSLRKSDTLKSVNSYFFVCLSVILLQIVASVFYLFTGNYYVLTFVAALFGITVVMLWNIISGIKTLFLVVQRDS